MLNWKRPKLAYQSENHIPIGQYFYIIPLFDAELEAPKISISIRKSYPHLSIFFTPYLYLMLNWKRPKLAYQSENHIPIGQYFYIIPLFDAELEAPKIGISIRKSYPHLSIFFTPYLYLMLNWKRPKLAYQSENHIPIFQYFLHHTFI